MTTIFAWHVHHLVLVELLTEPIEDRIKYIKTVKASTETQEQIALRLRLLRPVKGMLPIDYDEARDASDKARKVYDEAREACDEARKASDKARKALGEARKVYDEAREACDEAEKTYKGIGVACKTEIEALHKIECPDCPWDGETIFSESART